MAIHQNHQIVPRQVQLESLACGVIEGNNTDELEGEVALQKVNRQVLVRDHARFSINDAEVFDWMLRGVILIVHWAAHVQGNVDRADLVEQGEVLADLLPELGLKLNYADLVEGDLELVGVLPRH